MGSSIVMNDKGSRLYTKSWIETEYKKQQEGEKCREYVPTDTCIVSLTGCLDLEDFVVEEGKVNVSTMIMLDLESRKDVNEVSKLIVVPLIGVKSEDASSSGVLENVVLFLQFMLKKLEHVVDSLTRRIHLWARNAEGPKKLCNAFKRETTRNEEQDEVCSLVGDSMWGVV